MIFDDTICAIATPSGSGAIGIIRLSGNLAIPITQSIFKGANLKKVESHTIHYGHIFSDKKEIIDEVLVSVFLAPKTFTKENVVEINCHGSYFIQQEILNLLVKNGSRLAEPGEFTKRAFLNGRIDLSQAEAVSDLIHSASKLTHQIAINQLKGGIWVDLKEMREKLIYFVSLIELELDFSEEDVQFVAIHEVLQLIQKIINKINPLIDSFKYGNAIKNGVPVVIIGKPNVGKSTLLNNLLNEERAIVSDIPGTTRDSIEEKLTIEEITFRFIDTAGIRKTEDKIESFGIQKTYEKAKQAKIILYLFNKEEVEVNEVVQQYQNLKTENNEVIFCATKIDKYTGFNWDDWFKPLEEIIKNPLITYLSSKEKETLKELKRLLLATVRNYKTTGESEIIVNQRHLVELELIKTSLEKAKELLLVNTSGELVSLHLKEALKSIGNLTGAISVDEDILGTIFSSFCIGK